jgi:hypothetical protein
VPLQDCHTHSSSFRSIDISQWLSSERGAPSPPSLFHSGDNCIPCVVNSVLQKPSFLASPGTFWGTVPAVLCPVGLAEVLL